MDDDILEFLVLVIFLEYVFFGVNYIFRISVFIDKINLWNIIVILFLKELFINVRFKVYDKKLIVYCF